MGFVDKIKSIGGGLKKIVKFVKTKPKPKIPRDMRMWLDSLYMGYKMKPKNVGLAAYEMALERSTDAFWKSITKKYEKYDLGDLNKVYYKKFVQKFRELSQAYIKYNEAELEERLEEEIRKIVAEIEKKYEEVLSIISEYKIEAERRIGRWR